MAQSIIRHHENCTHNVVDLRRRQHGSGLQSNVHSVGEAVLNPEDRRLRISCGSVGVTYSLECIITDVR